MTNNSNSMIVQWFGDISLNHQFSDPRCHANVKAKMTQLAREAGCCDLRVGNLEAPLWGDGSVNKLKEPRLYTTEQAAKCILPLGLDVVFLGNNHVYDCREEGFKNTIEFLQKHNIKYLGAGNSQHEAAQPITLEKNGISLGIMNYVHRDTNPNVPSEAGVFLNYFDEKTVLKEIASLSQKVDVLLLYLHWGAEELIRLPSIAKRRFARQAVETGATVVVIDHAHCLQPHEYWRDGCVLYGIGNFIFGNVDDRDWPDLAYRTAIANVDISPGRVNSVRLDYLHCEDNIPIQDKKKSWHWSEKRLCFYIRLPESIYNVFYMWEKIYQTIVTSAFQFVKKSGGLIPSLLKIRKRHFSKIVRAVTGPPKDWVKR